MIVIFRIAAGALGLLLAGWQAWLLYLSPHGLGPGGPFFLPFNATLMVFGLFAVWFAVRGPQDLPKIGRTLVIGLIAGGVGFAAGILYALAPLLVGKEPGNLWPLLAIFCTGPAGFVLGCLGGFVWSNLARKA